MDLVVLVSFAAAAAAAMATISVGYARRDFERAVVRLARKLGLTILETKRKEARLAGELDGIRVELHVRFDFRLDDVVCRIDRRWSEDSFVLQSPADEPQVALPAVLDAAIQDTDAPAAYVDGALLEIVRRAARLEFETGTIEVHWQPQRWIDAPSEDFARCIEQLAGWVRRNDGDRAPLVERLKTKAMFAPDAATRARALRALRLHHPNAEPSRTARRAGLDDPEPLVRIEAATRLGPDGLLVLRKAIEDARVAATLRVLAIERFTLESPPELIRKVLLGVAFADAPAVAVAALGHLATVADTRTNERLVAQARGRAFDGATLLALIDYFGHTGGTEAIELLVSILEDSYDDTVVLNTTEAILRLGPPAIVRAIEVLETNHDRHEVVATLRDALGGGRAGALAIASTDEGKLSISDDA